MSTPRMTYITTYSFGDIVLVPFPFTDAFSRIPLSTYNDL